MWRILKCLLLSVCCMPLAAHAADVDWNAVKSLAKSDAAQVNRLVERLVAVDTSMTDQEMVQGYLANTYCHRECEADSAVVALLGDSAHEKNIANALASLERNPLDCSALIRVANKILELGKGEDGSLDPRHEKAAHDCYLRAFFVFKAIASTGDGSKEHPFATASVSDEYAFMRYFLHLWKYTSQSVVATPSGTPCDMFDLSEKSEYYSASEIYFDITRVLEMEKEMFGF